MKRRQLTSDERTILSLLGYGADNTRPTAYLAKMTGLSDRAIRKVIRDLVIDHGVPIVGVRNGAKTGYYIVSDRTTQERDQTASLKKSSAINCTDPH